MSPRGRGAFIVLEGLDRYGKSTQASVLCEALRAQGRKVSLWKYPARETFLGSTIDGYLKSSVSLPDETIHLLFSANRWETVDKLLSELRSGTDVVCDRYVYSGIAYSAAKGLDLEWCRAPDKGLPEPDIVLYMKVSAEVARERGGYGEERYEKEEFQRKVGDQFLSLGSRESNWRIINADRDQKTISAEVVQHAMRINMSHLMFTPRKLWVPEYAPEPLTPAHIFPDSPPLGMTISQLDSFTKSHGGKVRVRGRIHRVRKQGSKLAFALLRDRMHSVQIIAAGEDIAHHLSSFSKESIVDVVGTVTVPPSPVKDATQSLVEISARDIFLVSKSEDVLPVQMDDLNEAPSSPRGVKVSLETRLNHRVVDLRLGSNQALFTLQSAVCGLFRDFFSKKGFLEIHSPKLVSAASEGGASVFQVQYFEKNAFLAQSPQLYKQMAIMGDFPGVFEIGPVFRAENSLTHRHLTEFTGLDFEMPIERKWTEIIDTVDALFDRIFKTLSEEYKRELGIVLDQFSAQPVKWSFPCLKLDFKQVIRLLREQGPKMLETDIAELDLRMNSLASEEERKLAAHRKSELAAHRESLESLELDSDLGTSDEKLLGKIVKAAHDTDFYMVLKYPSAVRPFYTMPCPEDPQYTLSYDVFLRGEEIVSGAQRIHNATELEECAKLKNVDLSSVQAYIDSFKYGAFPHGGGGVGLERLVMFFCGIPNIRYASLFPRDPNRLTP